MIGRSDGKSACAAAAYRSGMSLYDARQDRVHDYSQRGGVVHSELMLPGEAPSSLLMDDPRAQREAFFNMLEASNKRKDAQLAFELLLTLPRECTVQENINLVRSFVREHFLSRQIPCDIALHSHRASDGDAHIHAHVLMCRRPLTADGFGKIDLEHEDNPRVFKRAWALEKEGRIEEALVALKGTNLLKWRKSWEVLQNAALEAVGSTKTVDCRTLKAQGIEREPEPVLGVFKYLDRGLTYVADRFRRLIGVRHRNALRAQLDSILQDRPDWCAEFISKARQFGRRLFPELARDGPEEHGRDRERGVGHER